MIINRKYINIFLAVAFSLYIPLKENFSFFYGHISFLIWIAIVLLINLKYLSKSILISTSITIILLLLTLWLALFINTGDRFIQDTIKIFIYIFSIIILSHFIKPQDLLEILLNMIILLPFILTYYIIFEMNTDLFSYADRLYLPYFGSPNVLGAVAALSILVLFNSFNISNIIKNILIIFYSSIIILGFSRAVILGLLAAIILDKKGRKVLIYLFLISLFSIIILLSFNIIDIPTWVYVKLGLLEGDVSIYQDARLIVWQATLQQIFNNSLSFILGSLPGKGVIILPGHTEMTMHPHNTYLFVIWAYGVIGFILFLLSLTIAIHKLYNEKIYYRLKKALLIFYIIVFTMDTYILAGQFLIIHTLIWSFLFSNYNISKKQKFSNNQKG